jgi:hypothetical protein
MMLSRDTLPFTRQATMKMELVKQQQQNFYTT